MKTIETLEQVFAIISTCPEHHISYSGGRHGTMYFHQDIGPARDSEEILKELKVPVETVSFDSICGRWFLRFKIPRHIPVLYDGGEG